MKLWLAVKIFVYWVLVVSGVMLLVSTLFQFVQSGSIILEDDWYIRPAIVSVFFASIMTVRFLLHFKMKEPNDGPGRRT